MPTKNSSREHAKMAAKALADINMVGAIMALAEHSLFSTACHPFEARIVRICQAESQKCLRRYDAALAKIKESK